MRYTLKNSTQTVGAMLMKMAILLRQTAFCVGLLGAMLMKWPFYIRKTHFALDCWGRFIRKWITYWKISALRVRPLSYRRNWVDDLAKMKIFKGYHRVWFAILQKTFSALRARPLSSHGKWGGRCGEKCRFSEENWVWLAVKKTIPRSARGLYLLIEIWREADLMQFFLFQCFGEVQ